MLERNQWTCEKSNHKELCCIGNEATHSFTRSSHAHPAMSMSHRRNPQIKSVQQTTKDLNDDRFSVWFVIISWMSWPAGMSGRARRAVFVARRMCCCHSGAWRHVPSRSSKPSTDQSFSFTALLLFFCQSKKYLGPTYKNTQLYSW